MDRLLVVGSAGAVAAMLKNNKIERWMPIGSGRERGKLLTKWNGIGEINKLKMDKGSPPMLKVFATWDGVCRVATGLRAFIIIIIIEQQWKLLSSLKCNNMKNI